jgi:glycosyltransferase involved in cell wall biosynthesis
MSNSIKRHKVLIVSHSSERSGAPKVLLDVAESLSPDKYDLTLCFPAEGGIAEDAERKGYRVKIIPNPQMGFAETTSLPARFKLFLSRLCFMFRLRREVKKGKYDLVYLNSTLSFYAGAALLRVGMKCIWHIHENLSRCLGNKIRRAIITHLSDFIIFASPTNVEFFKSSLKKTPWNVIPNGVRLLGEHQITHDPDFPKRFDYKPGDRIIATVSFLYYIKGIDIFLMAMKSVVRAFPDVKAVIVGDRSQGEKGYIQRLDNLADSLELMGRVHFAGYCENLPSFLRHVEIFVQPSRTESMPLTVLEAMAAGRAIVATDVGCVREMLDAPAAGVVVPPESPEAIAEALLTLLRNPEKRERLGTAARERVRREYSMEIFHKRINNIVEETLKGL